MRITKISVKGLFGMFDHEIPLNQESRITIVYGPNGVGKTVLMRMVHGLFNYEYDYIGRTPFDALCFEFGGNEHLSVSKDGPGHLLIEFDDGSEQGHSSFRLLSKPEDKTVEELVKELRPDLSALYIPQNRIKRYWVLTRDNQVFFPELLNDHDIMRELPSLHDKVYGETPAWFTRIQKKSWPKLVVTERLTSDSTAKDLSIQLTVARAFESRSDFYAPNYQDATLSLVNANLAKQVSDIGLFGFPKYSNIDPDDWDAFDEGFEERIQRLFTDMEYISLRLPDAINELAEHKCVLEAGPTKYSYRDLEESAGWADSLEGEIDDLRADFDRFEELQEFALRVSLLLNIVNERILFKTLKLGFSHSVPIEIEAEKNAELQLVSDHGNDVPLSALSSGEQHLLVLYYQLLFEIEPDTLVMIDEPELSMNVVWQRNFLKDLQRIIELRNFDVLIATHSPQIIHDKWDWMVPLSEKLDD